MVSHVWRGRARAALGLCAAAGLLASLSGCASAAAAPERSARAADGREEGASPPTPAEPLARPPSEPWTERAEGREGARPGDDGQVRLDLPPARPTALPADERPLLPERARLALVGAQDARLVRPAQALLDLGRELDDPRLAPVVGLGALPAGVTRVDLAALADEADAQGFDLLLVDVRQGAARDGVLLHAVTGAVLGVFEVRPGGLTTSAGRATTAGDDLVARVGAAWARTR
ncbi:MAG: hypothetical protein KF878_03065 [Planctomycetes bacterium]|nr:hypothetical protein [Planctomycetota bacterium]